MSRDVLAVSFNHIVFLMFLFLISYSCYIIWCLSLGYPHLILTWCLLCGVLCRAFLLSNHISPMLCPILVCWLVLLSNAFSGISFLVISPFNPFFAYFSWLSQSYKDTFTTGRCMKSPWQRNALVFYGHTHFYSWKPETLFTNIACNLSVVAPYFTNNMSGSGI